MMDDPIGALGGLRESPAMPAPAGMTPRQKVAMALQAQQGLFPQKPGMGGLSALGQGLLGGLASMQQGGSGYGV